MSDGTPRWALHLCALDADCRSYAGLTWRVEAHTPWGHLGIALRPGDRYVSASEDGGYRTHWISYTKAKR
jgi:hypothetical protein